MPTLRTQLQDKGLVIASHNPGKVAEIKDLLAPLAITLEEAARLGLPEPEETGTSFEDNALLKARAAAVASGLPALSDDSGLSVAALGGAPGIYSARWAGPKKDFARAMARVEEELAKQELSGPVQRRASFTAVLALAFPDGRELTFTGVIDGSLVFPPRGTRGFGYDPIFAPDGGLLTFGEMDPAEKHRISHRARAFAKFLQALEPGEGDRSS